MRAQPGDIAKEVVNITDDIKTLCVCTFIFKMFGTKVGSQFQVLDFKHISLSRKLCSLSLEVSFFFFFTSGAFYSCSEFSTATSDLQPVT